MFLKMQNFAASESLRILTTGKENKMKAKFHKNLDFLALFYVICISKGACEVSLWQRCTHQVSLETICPTKVFVVLILFNF